MKQAPPCVTWPIESSFKLPKASINSHNPLKCSIFLTLYHPRLVMTREYARDRKGLEA